MSDKESILSRNRSADTDIPGLASSREGSNSGELKHRRQKSVGSNESFSSSGDIHKSRHKCDVHELRPGSSELRPGSSELRPGSSSSSLSSSASNGSSSSSLSSSASNCSSSTHSSSASNCSSSTHASIASDSRGDGGATVEAPTESDSGLIADCLGSEEALEAERNDENALTEIQRIDEKQNFDAVEATTKMASSKIALLVCSILVLAALVGIWSFYHCAESQKADTKKLGSTARAANKLKSTLTSEEMDDDSQQKHGSPDHVSKQSDKEVDESTQKDPEENGADNHEENDQHVEDQEDDNPGDEEGDKASDQEGGKASDQEGDKASDEEDNPGKRGNPGDQEGDNADESLDHSGLHPVDDEQPDEDNVSEEATAEPDERIAYYSPGTTEVLPAYTELPSIEELETLGSQLTMDNVIMVLDTVYYKSKLESAQKGSEYDNLIAFVGPTGAGKSTLTNALIHGVESLGWTKKPGTMKDVIEMVDPKNTNIKIGHETAKSETFVPSVAKWESGDRNDRWYVADMPGRNDTNGPMVDLINSVMTNEIIGKARMVRLATLFVISSMTDNRGREVKNILDWLLKVLGGVSHHDIGKVMLPTVTMTRQTPSQLKEFDLEFFQSECYDIVVEEVKKKKLEVSSEELENRSKGNEADVNKFELFGEKFCYAIVAVDALNRNNERGEFKKVEDYGIQIRQLLGVKSKQVKIPLMTTTRINVFVAKGETTCKSIKEEFVTKAGEQGKRFTEQIEEEVYIKLYKTQLRKLEHFALVAKDTYANFQKELAKWSTAIEKEKSVAHMTVLKIDLDSAAEKFDFNEELEVLKDPIDFKGLTASLKDLYKLIQKVKTELQNENMFLGIDDSAPIELSLSSAKRLLEDVVSSMNKGEEEGENLIMFGANLISSASEDDDSNLVHELLTGQIRPDIMRSIIESNEFVKEKIWKNGGFQSNKKFRIMGATGKKDAGIIADTAAIIFPSININTGKCEDGFPCGFSIVNKENEAMYVSDNEIEWKEYNVNLASSIWYLRTRSKGEREGNFPYFYLETKIEGKRKRLVNGNIQDATKASNVNEYFVEIFAL